MAASKAQEVRKLMKEQLSVKRKVNHPLAKYNSLGQLTCQLCNTVLKSDLLWNTHLQSRKHKESIAALKEKKYTEHVSQKRDLEHGSDPAQPQAKKSKDSATNTNADILKHGAGIRTITPKQNEIKENEINFQLQNVNPNERRNGSNIVYHTPLYGKSVDRRNEETSRKVTSSTLVDSSKRTPRKSQGSFAKESFLNANISYNSEEEFVSSKSNKSSSINLSAIMNSSTSSSVSIEKPVTKVKPTPKSERSKVIVGTMPHTKSMEDMIKKTQDNIHALMGIMNKVIANQSQLQETMMRLEANQERIMGKMSFSSMSMMPAKEYSPSIQGVPPTMHTQRAKNTVQMATQSSHFQQNECGNSEVSRSNDDNIIVCSVSETEDERNTNPANVNQPIESGNEDHDKSAMVENVAENLVKYLTQKNSMELFDKLLSLVFEKETRSACFINLLQHLFTKEEMSDTWYGLSSIRPKKMLDPKRVSLIKEVTLIRFPPKTHEGETRKKILLNMNTRISNKCRFIRNRYSHDVIKKEAIMDTTTTTATSSISSSHT